MANGDNYYRTLPVGTPVPVDLGGGGQEQRQLDPGAISKQPPVDMRVTPFQAAEGDGVTLDDLRVEEPSARRARPASPFQVAEAAASGARAADAGTTQAAATGYNAQTGEIDPNKMTAAGQLTEITGRDSPLMQRAAQMGMLQAGKRGLQNSSIAAGMATGEMVDRATPLAQQDAATYFQNMRANLDAINRAREISTGRETDVDALNAQMRQQVNLQNAAFEQEMNQLNAQLETAVSQQNAEMTNAIRTRMAELDQQRNIFNAEAQNRLREMTTAGDIELNKQYLAGTQALDLQALQSRYQQLISTNQQAAMMYQGYMDAIGQAMANDRVTPERLSTYVNVMRSQLEGALEFMDAVNELGVGDVALPGAGYTRGEGVFPTEPTTGEAQPAPEQPPMTSEQLTQIVQDAIAASQQQQQPRIFRGRNV